MTKARKIWAVIASVVFIGLTFMVGYYWRKMGCEVNSLVAMIGVYAAFILAAWVFVDEIIKQKEN